MKIAAQLFTVREYVKTEKEIYQTLKKIKEIGYEIVQLSALGAYKPKNMKNQLDELGMSACVTHSPLDRIISDTEALITEHKLMGIKHIGLGHFLGNNLNEYKFFLDKLAPAVDKIAAAGLKFVYHNHAHELIKYDGVRPLDYMRDNTDSKKFGFLADFYWLQYAGICSVQFLKQYTGRVEIVHFKDMRAAAEGKSRFAEIYEGNMDYDSIYNACVKEGVLWAAVEQDVCDGDPFDSLKISRDNIRKRLGI